MRHCLVIATILLQALWSVPCMADIGETYSMKEHRKHLLQELQTLQTDSTRRDSSIQNRIVELNNEIIALDAAIFDSYDETIARMAVRKLDDRNNGKNAMVLGLLLCAASIVVMGLLFVARQRIQRSGYSGLFSLYRDLASDLFTQAAPDEPRAPGVLRVNVVVLIGLVMMSVSVIAYLVTAL